MKSILTAALLVLASPFIHAQYQPVTFPETIYAVLNEANQAWNIGTDTRSAYPGIPEETAPGYINFLNVTVSDHPEIMGVPRFYWNGSGLSAPGSQALPLDAVDPDVVLIDNPGFEIYALVVYHSNALGGYCYSYSKFTGSTFLPLSAPVLLEPYVNPHPSEIFINIDSDESGNFAVVYQKATSSICKTGTFPAGSAPPPTPGTPKIYNSLIQPDVAIQHSGTTTKDKVKIIGLSPTRSAYRVYTQSLFGLAGSSFISPSYPASSLNTPRIACPHNNTGFFAITLMKNIPGSGLYDIMLDVSNGTSWLGIKTVNDGSISGFPTAINSSSNKYPALCITSTSIVLGWHTEFLPGPPADQKLTFVGLDISISTMLPTSGARYLDICPAPKFNQVATIAIAGRYCSWGKTAAYEFKDPLLAQSGNRLVYSLVPILSTSWRPLNTPATEEQAQILLYPNPVKEILYLQLPNTNNSYSYSIFDILGRSVLTGDIDHNKAQIAMGKLPAGNYTLMLEQEGLNTVQKLQFIKQ